MGNASSSGGRGHHDESVDYGSLVPQGVYTGTRDWNHAIVSQLIVARKLAPFYRPLEEYEDSWDDDQILAARKELPSNQENAEPPRSESVHSLNSKSSHSKRSAPNKEQPRPEAAVYRGAVECPICFLCYPPNINHSRCCDQAICTECFVQIKRNEPTTTHLVSEPAACPYCVQDNFGIVYRPPVWRAGIGSDGSTSQWPEPPRESSQTPAHKRRQKSHSADSPEVVTTDQIRPDWEAKLAAVRAAVARRANRRIIMRQVGDRLIPIGVTSGRIHALNPDEIGAEAAEGGGSRRRRRHGGNSHLEQFMGMPGQDLEELMLMEAMRLSLIEHEEQQRKEADEKRKQEAAAAGNASDSGPSQTPAGAGSSTLATSPSNLSIPSSSQASLAPVSASPASHQSTDSSEINSRSRPPSNHRSSSESSSTTTNSTTTSRNDRTPNPRPFSTLTAALASASTATAILGPPLSRQSQDARSTGSVNSLPPRTGSPSIPSNATTTAIPAITIVHDGYVSPKSNDNNDNPDQEEQDQECPPVPPKPKPASSTSSVNIPDADMTSRDELDDSVYGHLPSSPDSDLVNEPLLGASRKPDGIGAWPSPDA